MRCAKPSLYPTTSLTCFVARHAAVAHPERLLADSRGRVACLSNSHNIFHNLTAEEALLRGVVLQPAQQLLFLYVNRPCVVIGRNQNLQQEVALRAAQRDGVAVARRSSGGGAVYHDRGNVCFSFFTHRDAYHPAKTIQLLRLFLCQKYGIQPDRVTTTSRHDLFLDGMKITGSAMRVQRDIAYHHCTLLASSCRRRLGAYLHSEGQYVSFSSAAIGSVRSPVTTLEASGVLPPSFSSSSVRGSGEDVICDMEAAAAKFFLRHSSEILAHPAPWELDVSALSAEEEEEEAAAAAAEVTTQTSTRTYDKDFFVLDVAGALQQKTLFIDAEGRRPAAGSPHTLQEECNRLRSAEWLFAMPKFETRVVVTAADFLAWKGEGPCLDDLPPDVVAYVLQDHTELEITTVVESRRVVLLTSRWVGGATQMLRQPWCTCLLKLLLEGVNVDDLALDLSEGNAILEAAIRLECQELLYGLRRLSPPPPSSSSAAHDGDGQRMIRCVLQAVVSVWRAKNVFFPIDNINLD